jgi:hypothetical protein
MHETAPSPGAAATAAPRASVVVVARDADRLARLLDALERQTVGAGAFEVVVVGGPTGGARPVSITAVGPAGGPAAARNAGWRAAQAPLVAFAGEDCEPEPEWLEHLLESAEERPGVIVQGRTLPGTFAAEANAGPDLFYPAVNILFPRAALEVRGGFDEAYGPGDDTDLAWRARDAGVEVVYAPAARVRRSAEDPVAALKDAYRTGELVKVYRDHPGLRAQLDKGLFLDPSHPLLAQALVAVWMARRTPVAAVFGLPYVLALLRRVRAAGAPAHVLPLLAARDVAELAGVLRGAIRTRTPVL